MENQPSRLKRAKDWVVRKTKNAGYSLAQTGLGISKAVIREGRQNLIAGKIATKGITRKLHKDEKSFLKKQGANLAKSVPLVATTAIPLPGVSMVYGVAANKLNLVPKKLRMPKGYGKKHQWTAANSWIDRKRDAVDKAKAKYNATHHHNNY
jgi:hypothetical protein